MDAMGTELLETQYYGCCVVDLYNGWRPHRILNLTPPNGRPVAATSTRTQPITLRRRDRLGRLLHEYERAA